MLNSPIEMLKALFRLFLFWPLALFGMTMWWIVKQLWGGAKWTFKRVLGRKGAPIHGDAKWATLKDLRAARNLEARGFHVGSLKGRNVYTHEEASLLLFAKRGWGKSVTIGSSLKNDSKHVLCIDPAGELHRKHGEALKQRGYDVEVVDLQDGEGGYDPFTFFRYSTDRTIDDDVALLAEMIIPDDEGTKHEHFIDMPRILLAGVVKSEVSHYKKRMSVYQCAELLAAESESVLTTYFAGARKLPQEPLIKSAIKAYDSVGNREKGSFISTMVRKFRPFMSLSIRELKGEWDWEEKLLNPKPQAVFVSVGIGQSPLRAPYTRLVVGLCLATVQRMYNRTKSPVPLGLNIYVDEASLLGDCPPIVTAVTDLRKAGVNVLLAYQDTGQVYGAFGKERGGVLMSNCDWMIGGGSKDINTYRTVSDLIGDETITATSKSSGKYGTSESEHQTAKRFVKAEQIFNLPADETICLLNNLAAKLIKPRP